MVIETCPRPLRRTPSNGHSGVHTTASFAAIPAAGGPAFILRPMAVAAVFVSIPLAAYGADLGASETPSVSSGQVDTNTFASIDETLHDWKVTIGGGAIVQPEYEGSDEFKILPFPLFSASFGDSIHVDPSGATVDIFERDGFSAGLKAGYELGRKEDDSGNLRGLGDVDPGGVVGGQISYEMGPLEIYAKLDKTIGGSNGLTGALGTTLSHRYERFVFSGDISATWADDNHMEAYFGISPGQSANSGLPEFEAEAGIKRIDVKGSVTYMLTDSWFATSSAGVGVLVGDAKDSPIVRDEFQPFAMMGLGYRF